MLGIGAGALSSGLAAATHDGLVATFATLGGLWLNALKVTVIPLIVALLIKGVIGGAAAASEGRIAARTVVWIAILYVASAALGLVAMPGLLAVFPLPESGAAAFRAGLATIDASTVQQSVATTGDFLRSFIPSNIVAAAAEGSVLQILVFTLAFAFALSRMSESQRAPVVHFFDTLGAAMLIVIGWVLWLAPAGVFALAFIVGEGAGASAFGAVLHYVLLYSSISLLILLLSYPLAVAAGGFRLPAFARAIAPSQAIAFSTQSSVASLPAMLASAKMLEVRDSTADISLPLLVALFRVTGPAMNLAVCFYIAHLLGYDPSWQSLVAGFLVAAVISAPSPGLPGQISFITTIGPIAIAMGLPIAPLGLFVALEPIPDMFRTMANVSIDVAVTGAIDRSSGSPDASASRSP